MKNLTKTKSLLLASSILLTMNTHAADEAALYDLAPENSAFVRIISNVSDKAINVKIADKLLLSQGHCQASSYEYVPAGAYEFTVEGKNWSGELSANKTYTFVLNNEHVNVIEDDIFNNPKKGQFAAYNLTDKETIAVKTKDGKKAVFPTVAANEHVSREVNPIKIDLAIYDANTKLLETNTARFQRGKSKNLFVCGSQQNYLASWINQ